MKFINAIVALRWRIVLVFALLAGIVILTDYKVHDDIIDEDLTLWCAYIVVASFVLCAIANGVYVWKGISEIDKPFDQDKDFPNAFSEEQFKRDQLNKKDK